LGRPCDLVAVLQRDQTAAGHVNPGHMAAHDLRENATSGEHYAAIEHTN
jgi:hypothetical protein